MSVATTPSVLFVWAVVNPSAGIFERYAFRHDPFPWRHESPYADSKLGAKGLAFHHATDPQFQDQRQCTPLQDFLLASVSYDEHFVLAERFLPCGCSLTNQRFCNCRERAVARKLGAFVHSVQRCGVCTIGRYSAERYTSGATAPNSIKVDHAIPYRAMGPFPAECRRSAVYQARVTDHLLPT